MDDRIKIKFSKQKLLNKWSSVKTFFTTPKGKALLTTLLILIPVLLSFTIRAQPATLGAFDSIGEQNVDQQLINQFSQQIRQENPALPSNSIRAQAQEQLQTYKTQNADQYQQQADQITTLFKDQYKKPNGEPYLVAIDPYNYLREARNYQENGHLGNEIVDGVPRETYQLAPIGKNAGSNLHPVLANWMYTLFGGITGLSFYMMFFYMPAILASLAPIPAFFLAKNFAGKGAGFLTAIIVATHSSFVSRSVAGFSDTDPYNVALPLFVLWFAHELFIAKTLKKKMLWGGLATLSLGTLSAVWGGWYATYAILLAALFGNIIHTILKNAIKTYREGGDWAWSNLKDVDTKSNLVTTGAFLLSTGVVVALARNIASINILDRITGALALDQAVGQELWPNVLTTVAELGSQDFSGALGAFGTQTIVLLGLIGTLTLLLPKEYKDGFSRKVYYWWFAASSAVMMLPFLATLTSEISIVLIALTYMSGYGIRLFEESNQNLTSALLVHGWIITFLVASLRGVRFNFILMPMIALGLSIFVVTVVKWLRKTDISTGAKFTTITAFLLLVGLYVSPIVVQGYQAGERVPGMNDAWYNSLQTIDEETAEDTIITSWWDFGHWFKQVADRPVTFDGATQNTPAAHWVGNLLQTSDEQQSLNTLRMLNCGNREGYDALLEATLAERNQATPAQHVENKQNLDEALTITSRDEAVSYYETLGATQSEAENIASLTHCEAPTSIVITSEDMVGKAPVWAHFGQWDFKKAYAAQTFDTNNPTATINRYAETLSISQEEARRYYLEISELQSERQRQNWIAPRPQYITQRPTPCEEDNGTVECSIDRTLNQQRGQRIVLESLDVDLDSPSEAQFTIGVYSANNFRQQGETIPVDSLFLGDGETLQEYSGGNNTGNIVQGLGFSALLHQDQENYELLLGDRTVLPSMFTRLFFFDGAYTENYELLTEEQSRVAGTDVKVWQADI